MQLSKYLKEADQTKSLAERYRLLKMAVELGEKMELQIGHQGRLYDMAANAAYQCEGIVVLLRLISRSFYIEIYSYLYRVGR